MRVLLLLALLLCTGCPREAFVPGCDDATSTPDVGTEITGIGWSGQDLLDRVTGTFVESGTWEEAGTTTEVTLTVTPTGDVTLHELTEQDPPPGAAVAAIAPLCFDYLSVAATVTLQTDDGALDESFDATATVTGDDSNPATRSANLSGTLDPAGIAGTYTITEIDTNEWDSVSLHADASFRADGTAPGTFGVSAERAQGDVAEAVFGVALTWGEAE